MEEADKHTEMKIYLVIFLTVFLSNCSSLNTRTRLFDAYAAYLDRVDRKNIQKLYLDYFTQSLLDGESVEDPEVTDQLLFKTYMNRIYSHYEEASDTKGCLTINGFDRANMPLSFNLAYEKKRSWKINGIQIRFVSSIEEFDTQVHCPLTEGE